MSTPQIVPGNSEEEGVGTPIVTWGEVGGAPMIIDEDDRPKGPVFSIANVPSRDKLNIALNKENAEKLRKKQQIDC